MQSLHRLILSPPAKFAARRIADASDVEMTPEVVQITKKLRGWVTGSDRNLLLSREDSLIGAMGTFPSPAALRLMAAVMMRLPTYMRKWVAEDKRLRRRVGHINRMLFVDHAFEAGRVARINDTARRFIDLYGIREE